MWSLLLEQGKLSLQVDIRKYLPEMPDSGQAVNDTLLAHHQRHDDIKFTLTDINKFSTRAWWTGNLVFTRNAKGMVEGFLVDAGRAKNLRFFKE